MKSLFSYFKKSNPNGQPGENESLAQFMKAVEMLNEKNIDYRRLNFLRLTLLKDNQGNATVPLETFLKNFQNIIKIQINVDSELYDQIKLCILEDTVGDD